MEVHEKFQALKAMNLLAHLCNNEGFYYNHWIYIIPDDVDDEELMDIAVNDPGTYSDAVRCFINHFQKYALTGGFYIDDAVYPN